MRNIAVTLSVPNTKITTFVRRGTITKYAI